MIGKEDSAREIETKDRDRDGDEVDGQRVWTARETEMDADRDRDGGQTWWMKTEPGDSEIDGGRRRG